MAGQLDAYNALDLERFLEHFVDDVPVLTFPGNEVMADRSGPAFRVKCQELFTANPGLHVKLVSRMVHGRIVVDQELVTGLSSGGVRSAVAMYEVGEEKIQRVWFVA
ncbi:hypothetical protein [Umezawaea tangerina]|uniref:SnoaL-like domain-containing protein n=1 Tax=Umezawaea tangerina TaxID=84725 RepID=A0A2T0SMX9_9PSEU|nr:hypothetical protein [Umezawaea tangerina]PRY34769.1 hypothetical protein CLV43_11545 [Umezawaea tangerina]